MSSNAGMSGIIQVFFKYLVSLDAKNPDSKTQKTWPTWVFMTNYLLFGYIHVSMNQLVHIHSWIKHVLTIHGGTD